MSGKTKQAKSTKSKGPKLSDCIWEKKVPPQFSDSFKDAYKLYMNLQSTPNVFMIFSTGNLQPDSLTKQDHGKHGAIYVSINDMPEFFNKKKFDTNVKLKKHFQEVQEFAEKYIAPHMTNDSTLSVEIMGIQNREFNRLQTKTVVIPHGSIVAVLPKKFTTKEELEGLCELSVHEGYVVVNHSDGQRYKLKREYFDSKVNPEQQRGPHKTEPENYTADGLTLCGGKGFGYDGAVVSMLTENKSEPITIAKLVNGVDLIALPIATIIEKQNRYPFDGDKMMNFYETTGKGNTYKYTDKPFVSDIFNHDLEFQLKFDGETGMLHKDKNGKAHLLVKFQIDVFEIESNDGSKSYRFGWM